MRKKQISLIINNITPRRSLFVRRKCAYSITGVGYGADPGFLAVSSQMTLVINPVVGCRMGSGNVKLCRPHISRYKRSQPLLGSLCVCESAIGCVLFDERLGCFNDPPPAEARHFIQSLCGFFKYQQPLMYGLPTYKIFPTRAWRTFETYTDQLIKQAQKFVVKVYSLLLHCIWVFYIFLISYF